MVCIYSYYINYHKRPDSHAIAYFYGVLNPIKTSYKSKSRDVDYKKVLFCTKLHVFGFYTKLHVSVFFL